MLDLVASTSSLRTPSPPFPPTPPTPLLPTALDQFSLTPPLPNMTPESMSPLPTYALLLRQDTPHLHTGNVIERVSNKRLRLSLTE